MRAWRTHRYGQPLEVLQLDRVPIPAPGPGELRVRVQAIPLNLNDLERITGGNMMVRPELPYSPGMEVMGIVDACGEGAAARLGERVVAMSRAHTAASPSTRSVRRVGVRHARSDSASRRGRPLLPFHLAWLGLFDRAQLRAGESVLIHAAAGGSGSAAIQLAVHAGARVFATAGGAEKLKLCRELGAHVAIDYSEQDFAAIVLAETNNRGVDVVFDNVGEAVVEKSMKCIAYNGRYLMMGFASDKTRVDEKWIVPRQLSVGNFKLCGVMLAYAPDGLAQMLKKGMGWNLAPDALGERITREIVDLVLAKQVRPVIGRVVEIEELPAAIDAMANRQTVGRTIVKLY